MATIFRNGTLRSMWGVSNGAGLSSFPTRCDRYVRLCQSRTTAMICQSWAVTSFRKMNTSSKSSPSAVKKREKMARFLTKTIGLDGTVTERSLDSSGLMSMTNDNVEKRLKFLREASGLSTKEIRKMFPTFARVLACDKFEDMINFLTELFRGNKDAIRRIILESLPIRTKDLRDVIEYVSQHCLEGNQAMLRSVIVLFPKILRSTSGEFSRLQKRVEIMARNGLEVSSDLLDVFSMSDESFEDWPRIANFAKTLSADSPDVTIEGLDGEESFQDRVDFLTELFGGDKETSCSIVRRVPTVLTKSVERHLKPTRDYLLNDIFDGDNIKLRLALKQYPRLLTLSLRHHVKPRIMAITKAGQQPSFCLDCVVRLQKNEFETWQMAPTRHVSSFSTDFSPIGKASDEAHLDSEPWRDACRAVSGLSVKDSLSELSSGRICLKSPPVLVESVEGLLSLEEDVFASADLVALDTEFRSNNRGAVFQLSFRPRNGDELETFVVDLMAADHDEVFRRVCRTFIEKLFLAKTVVGFAVRNDLKAIDSVLGSNLLPRAEHVLDVQQLWGNEQPSLASCVQKYSSDGRKLWKGSQAHGWEKRPLSSAQLEYAALDAAVLLVILAEKSREDGIVEEKSEQGGTPDKYNILVEELGVTIADAKAIMGTAARLQRDSGSELREKLRILRCTPGISEEELVEMVTSFPKTLYILEDRKRLISLFDAINGILKKI